MRQLQSSCRCLVTLHRIPRLRASVASASSAALKLLSSENPNLGRHLLGVDRHFSSTSNNNSYSDPPRHGRLIVLRHGQSEWNAGSEKSEARFTGWCNIGLTELGRAQALAAAKTLREFLQRERLQLDCAYVSLLDRAKDTLYIMLEELQLVDTASGIPKIPVTASWRLNERHYGALVGQSKSWAEQEYSKDLLDAWRYSWWEPPPPMDEETLAHWRTLPHCQRITFVQNPRTTDPKPKQLSEWTLLERNTYQRGGLQNGNDDKNNVVMPASEAFGHVLERLLPIWNNVIAKKLALGQTVLLVGHANSMRAMLHLLDPRVVNEDTVRNVKIPNTTPLVYEFESPLPSGGDVADDSPTETSPSIVRPLLLDLPLRMEPRHALRGLWLERAWIPALPNGEVVHKDRHKAPDVLRIDSPHGSNLGTLQHALHDIAAAAS